MATKIGRVGTGTLTLPAPTYWRSASYGGKIGGQGGDITLRGFINTTPANALLLRDQLLGYQDNLDEPVVPVIVDSEPRLNGYYTVTGVQIITDPGSIATGKFDYIVGLSPVSGFAAPLMESLLNGALLTNVVGGLVTDYWPSHVIPAAAVEYWATGFGSLSARIAEGFEMSWRQVAISGSARFFLPVSGFYNGAATIEQGTVLQPVVGRQQFQVDLAHWRLSNGLVRVTPNASVPGAIDVSHFNSPITGGDFERFTTTGTLFRSLGTDATGTLNAWTTDAGSPSIASNVLTLPSGAAIHAGHSDWSDVTARVRFKWVTAGAAYLYLHYVDANNWIRAQADGTNLLLQKCVAGATTTVSTTAAALVNNTQYWLQLISSGTTYSAFVLNDAAGASSTTLATSGSQIIADNAIQTGVIRLEAFGASILFGGAFANVCTVTGNVPTGWFTNITAGEPAFAWSTKRATSGTRSLSIYLAHSSGSGYWLSASSLLSGLSYTLSAQGLLVTGSTGTAQVFAATGGTPIVAVTPADSTWRGFSNTAVSSVGQAIACQYSGGVGTAYFDQVYAGRWAAAKTYQISGTNAGLVNAIVAVTILRNATEECILRLGMNLTDFGRTNLDLSLKRGDTIVRGYFTNDVGDPNWTIKLLTPEASSAITYGAVTAGGIRATANDADGNRFVLLSYQQAVTNDLVKGALTLVGSAAKFDLCIGSEVGGSGAVFPNRAQDLAGEYLAAQSESQRVVAR